MAFVVRRAGSGGGLPPARRFMEAVVSTCSAKHCKSGSLCRRQSCNGLPAALERGGAPGAIGRRSRASKASVALATQASRSDAEFLCARAQRNVLCKILFHYFRTYFVISALISLFRTYFGFTQKYLT